MAFAKKIVIDNVIIFGDSLSDIGIKVNRWRGKLGHLLGAMLTNDTGRFSTGRNWTDYMYEEATAGDALFIDGNPEFTLALSKKFHLFNRDSKTGIGGATTNLATFYYANYAVGGACADSTNVNIYPLKNITNLGLTKVETQVDEFQKHYNAMIFNNKHIKEESFLFIIWIGANDLFTANRNPQDMHIVATNVVEKLRTKITNLVGMKNAHFVFINLPSINSLPVVRYRKQLESVLREGNKVKISDEIIFQQELENGVKLYNETIKKIALRRGDKYVDMYNFSINSFPQIAKDENFILSEAPITSSMMPPKSFTWSKEGEKNKTVEFLTTNDQIHPTERIYELMWEKVIKPPIAANYRFGTINNPMFSRRFSISDPVI